MASLTLILPSFALSSSSTRLPLRKPCAPPFTALFKLKPLPSQNPSNRRGRRRRRRIKNGTCRAEFSHDAPFAAAIGACVLTSLVFAASTREGDESDAVMDSTDTRFAVMGIVSFIPYFNWLSWVFAWLDTGKRRYAVYSLVYLAPYLRSNLSLSPEESWLPIASIVLCILHVQLEASIRNGDIHGFQLFSEAAKLLSLEKHRSLESEMKHMNLPSSETRAGKDMRHGDVPGRPSRDQEHATGGDWDDDDDEIA